MELRGANGCRHGGDFRTVPSPLMSRRLATTVQITMTSLGSSDLSRAGDVTLALPRDALAAVVLISVRSLSRKAKVLID